MMKYTSVGGLFLLLSILIGFVACSEQNTYVGVVFEIGEGKVLVLDSMEQEDLGKSWDQIIPHYSGKAIWLLTKKELSVGQKIRYKINGEMLNTYPAQAEASWLEMIK